MTSPEHQVTLLPSGHTFNVADGESVLDAALRQGIGLPYGCRNGACGSCKGKIVSGDFDYGVYQERTLRPEEKAVFLLRQNGDLTYEEIAELRRSPVGTVKTQMRSALQKLRRVLKDM